MNDADILPVEEAGDFSELPPQRKSPTQVISHLRSQHRNLMDQVDTIQEAAIRQSLRAKMERRLEQYHQGVEPLPQSPLSNQLPQTALELLESRRMHLQYMLEQGQLKGELDSSVRAVLESQLRDLHRLENPVSNVASQKYGLPGVPTTGPTSQPPPSMPPLTNYAPEQKHVRFNNRVQENPFSNALPAEELRPIWQENLFHDRTYSPDPSRYRPDSSPHNRTREALYHVHDSLRPQPGHQNVVQTILKSLPTISEMFPEGPPTAFRTFNKEPRFNIMGNELVQTVHHMPAEEVRKQLVEALDALTRIGKGMRERISVLENQIAEERKKKDEILAKTRCGQELEPSPEEWEELRRLDEYYRNTESLLGNTNQTLVGSTLRDSTIERSLFKADLTMNPMVSASSTSFNNYPFLRLLNTQEFEKAVFGDSRTPFPIVTIHRDSLIPWLNYWKDVFSRCFLHGLYVLDPRLLPTTEDGWKECDNKESTQAYRKNTIYGFKVGAGTIPEINRDDCVAKQVGILLAVVECWPQIVPRIFQKLATSVGKDLAYVKENLISPNFLNLRLIWFTVLRHHLLPQAQALNHALTNFLTMKNLSVSRNEPPASFAAKLREGQRTVNVQFRRTVIGEEILEVMFLMGLKELNGAMYSNVIDSMTLTGLSTAKKSFQEMVDVLQEKWNSLRNERVALRNEADMITKFQEEEDEHHDFTDLGTGEAAFSAEYAPRPNSRAFEFKQIEDNRRHGRGGLGKKVKKPEDPKDQPCFQFAKNGECKFGDKCKYSHKPVKDAVFTLSEILTQYDEVLKPYMEKVNLLRQKKNHWKNKYQKARHWITEKSGGALESKRDNRARKVTPKTKFYEDVVKNEEANSATTSKGDSEDAQRHYSDYNSDSEDSL